jgi:sugar phosphate isomerase/epimerase
LDADFEARLAGLREIGVTSVHLFTSASKRYTAAEASAVQAQLARHGIAATCLFAGFAGESYTDIPATRCTVGLAPPETRESRAAALPGFVDFAAQLGVRAVGLHVGFVPHDANDREYEPLVAVTRHACDACAARGRALHLETGQEPADVLLRFMADADRPNLYVNFDPANMILYGAGDPIAALETVGPRVQSVHCKDAVWSDRPGETWGRETSLGEGDVDFAAFLLALERIGYDGPLTIERESADDPERWLAEVARGLDVLRNFEARTAGDPGETVNGE